MSCHARVDEWTTMIRTPIPHLSKPQATVLALWSMGMVLARSCRPNRRDRVPGRDAEAPGEHCTAAVGGVVRRSPGQTGRTPPGPGRGGLLCPAAALGTAPVARHPTGLGPRCHHLGDPLHAAGHQCGLSGLCHPRSVDHPARRHPPCLAPRVAAHVAHLAAGLPTDSTVIVLAERGLYAGWLFGASAAWAGIPSCGSLGGTFRPDPQATYRP